MGLSTVPCRLQIQRSRQQEKQESGFQEPQPRVRGSISTISLRDNHTNFVKEIIHMRKLTLGVLAVFAIVALLAVVAVKVRSEPASHTVAVVALTPDQAKALKQVDDLLSTLKRQ